MTSTRLPPITVVGLGPGDASLLTAEAIEILSASQEAWLRTSRHPAVAGLPVGPRYESFDDAYESSASFEAVYETIVERVLTLAARPEGVVYAVPGHPLFGEATVRALLERAERAGFATRVVAGVSFLDVVTSALRLDPLADGLLLLDALALSPSSHLLQPGRPTVIAQVYDRRAATQVKLALLDAYPPHHSTLIIRASGTPEPAQTAITIEQLDRSDSFDHLTTIYVPPLTVAGNVRSFDSLCAIVAKLRSPDGGCPWDLEQTHETLKRFLLEEAYEALDALDGGESHRIAEELGDLMMQVVLHAQVAEDAGEFSIDDVIASISTKLVRRHPHVFGDVVVEGAADVLRNWEELKKEEREGAPVLDAVPKAMPALAQAQALQSRATKAHLDHARVDADAVLERLARFTTAEKLDPQSLGEILFDVVALGRAHDIDAEEALRVAARRFRAQVDAREAAERLHSVSEH